MEEHLTTDQRVAGSNPVTDDFFLFASTVFLVLLFVYLFDMQRGKKEEEKMWLLR